MKFAKILATVTLTVLPVAAVAHPAHVADSGYGHSHWLAIAALVAIAAVGYSLLRRRNPEAQRKITDERG